jgi:2-amino-4-hydroxy-6-hydroxymethyldihydropteridine diphosphokinase
MPETVYLSLGSNLGDREFNIVRALESIKAMEGFDLISCSSVYISEAAGMDPSAPFFLNMVIKGQFDFTPLELLGNLEGIESDLGRETKGDNRPRPIDIDILLFGNEIVESGRLTIPHPRMLGRPFVYVPLLQIEPELVHPVNRRKIHDIAKQKDADNLILYKEFDRYHV